MEVRIGIVQSPRELSFETEASVDDIQQQVEAALTEQKPLISFSDAKGKHLIVPTASLAYLEFGGDTGRRVGFVS